MQVRKPRRGDELELVVDRIDEKGHGVGRAGDYTIRVRAAVPGARIRAEVKKRRGDRIDASIAEVLEPSPSAIAPRCPHFGTCGGCSFQGVDYPAQLEALGALLARTLAPLELAPGTIDPVIGCDEPWGYRNKMDFTFATRRWIEDPERVDDQGAADDGFALGLHVPGRFDKVLDLRQCDIAFVEAPPIVTTARALAREHDLEAWDVRAHHGLLRHLVLRKGLRTGEIMAVLVTTDAAPERVDPYAAALCERHPEIDTLVQLVHPEVSMVATGDVERVLHGTGRIEEVLRELRFSISAHTFFQTNTVQADRLLEIVREEARVTSETLALDLYCGCGPITLDLARSGARVIGFELVEEAIADARLNAQRNGLEEVKFVAGDLAETLTPEALDRLEAAAPDVCVVDPPRAGLHPRVLGTLRRLQPPRIVFVSCNPRAAVRDALPLVRDGYQVRRVRPVDLFPHTPHLECVMTLERKNGVEIA